MHNIKRIAEGTLYCWSRLLFYFSLSHSLFSFSLNARTHWKRNRLSETEIELRLLNCLHYYLANNIQCTLSSIVEYVQVHVHIHAHIHTTQFSSKIKFQLMFTRCDDDIHLFFAHHLMNYKLYKFGWLLFYLHYLIYVIILE